MKKTTPPANQFALPFVLHMIYSDIAFFDAMGHKDHVTLYFKQLLSITRELLSDGIIGCLKRSSAPPIYLTAKQGRANTKKRKGFEFDNSFLGLVEKEGDISSHPTEVIVYNPVNIHNCSYVIGDIFSKFSGSDHDGFRCISLTTRQILSIVVNNLNHLSHKNYFVNVCQDTIYIVTVHRSNDHIRFESCRLFISRIRCEPEDLSNFFMRSDLPPEIPHW